MQDQRWIDWIEQLRAIAQNGLAYAKGEFDLERYRQLQIIAHEMTALVSGAPLAAVDHYFVGEHGYTTPKVDIRAGVFKDNQILLVKERLDGCWAMPGGWADVCEPPARGAERETLEESGYIVKAKKLAAVRDTHRHPYHPRNAYHIIKLLFLCELEGGEPRDNYEITDIQFFPTDQLPGLSQGRTISSDIALMTRHRDTPSLPTEFD